MSAHPPKRRNRSRAKPRAKAAAAAPAAEQAAASPAPSPEPAAPPRAESRTERLFTLIWRMNALLIAAVGLAAVAGGTLGAGLLAYELWGPAKVEQVVRAPSSSAAGEARLTASDERAEGFQPLGGTGLLYAPIREIETITGADTGRSYSKRAVNTVDWLIYDPASALDRQLIGVRPNLLIEARSLQWRSAPGAPLIDVGLFVRHVVTDTTGDGLLTTRDQETFALARADGQELTPLPLGGVYLSLTLIGRNEAVLLLQTETGPVAAHLDLAERRITRTVALTVGPAQVSSVR